MKHVSILGTIRRTLAALVASTKAARNTTIPYTMNIKCRSLMIAVVTTIAAIVTPLRAAPFTLSDGTPGNFDSYSSWGQGVVASVTLNAGTSQITSLTSSAVAVDQGWGGYDPNDNQVFIGLFDNATLLSWVHVAGGLRYDYSVQSFTADALQLSGFDTALAGINWLSSPLVTMEMVAAPLGYPGWELHVSNASFTVSGDTSSVPDGGTTAAMLGAGMIGLITLRRRFLRA